MQVLYEKFSLNAKAVLNDIETKVFIVNNSFMLKLLQRHLEVLVEQLRNFCYFYGHTLICETINFDSKLFSPRI